MRAKFSEVSILTDTSSRCLICYILSWSYDGVCSDTEYNNSVGSEVPQCVLCGCCVEFYSCVVANLVHSNTSIGL